MDEPAESGPGPDAPAPTVGETGPVASSGDATELDVAATSAATWSGTARATRAGGAATTSADASTAGEGGRIARWRAAAMARWDRFLAWLQEALSVVPALDLGWELGRRFRGRNGSVLAGHITYRLFLWIPPYLLLLTALLGFALTSSVHLTSYATEASGASDSFVDQIAEQATSQRFNALVLGLFGLAIATAGLVRGMHYVYAQAWELEVRPRAGIVRSVWRSMVAAIVLTAVMWVIGAARNQGLLLKAGSFAVAFALYTAAFFALAWVLPRRTRSLWELIPGALLCGVALTVLQIVMRYYLPERAQGSMYGALGGALAMLLYLWCIATLMVANAFVGSVWHDRNEILAGRPWVADPEKLPGWLRRLWTRGTAASPKVIEQATRLGKTVERKVSPTLARYRSGDEASDEASDEAGDEAATRPAGPEAPAGADVPDVAPAPSPPPAPPSDDGSTGTG